MRRSDVGVGRRGIARGITNGDLDDGDPAVVALVLGNHVGCTGALISPRVVLTAAHCVADWQAVPGKRLSVFFGAQFGGAGEVRIASSAAVHPQFDAVSLRNDVGIVVLADPAPSQVAPLALWKGPLDGVLVGATVRLIGFGGATASGDSGIKRSGTTSVDAIDDNTFRFGDSPSQTCLGDSGGPALMKQDGVEALVGVTSSGDLQCASYGQDQRLDRVVADFIEPMIAAAADCAHAVDGGTGVGSCAATGGGCQLGGAGRTNRSGWPFVWLAMAHVACRTSSCRRAGRSCARAARSLARA